MGKHGKLQTKFKNLQLSNETNESLMSTVFLIKQHFLFGTFV